MLTHMLPFTLIAFLVGGLPADLSKQLGCSAKRPCAVVDEKSAGLDAEQVKLKVLHVSRSAGPDGEGECQVEEYWLVRLAKPLSARLLLSLCNDGYGAAGVGEDTVTVKANRLVHDQFGGSAWRWGALREFQLAPPLLVSTHLTSFHASSPNLTDETTWSWVDFKGERVRMLSRCDDDGQPDLREEVAGKAVRSVLLPRVALPDDYVAGGWKTVALGGCSATASYVTFGGKGTPEDATLKVVARDNVLFVEVTDDAWVTNAQKWLAGDHLELWLGTELPSTTTDCLGKAGGKATQWAIDLPSGVARAGFGGRVGLPKAEVVQLDQTVRVKLTLPPGEWRTLALVYSDSDDGQKQERLIATSQLVYPQAATLGDFLEVSPKLATCEVRDGVLSPVSKWSPPAKGALFPPSGD